MIDIFIPSYHRAKNLKTVKYFHRLGWDMDKIHVVIDDEADDYEEYEQECKSFGCQLHVFNMADSIKRFDYVHRPSPTRRSAGQARNMFYDIADELGIRFFVMMDDDTTNYQYRPFAVYKHGATLSQVLACYEGVKKMMVQKRIGLFGLSQTGDLFERYSEKILRNKVMNTTFVNCDLIYRGERGVQDDDTSQFVTVMNEGYFTGSLASMIVLSQTASATAKGGLTDLYNELKLLNKATVTPIQFPSCCRAEKQKRNGGRLHHRINYRYLMPKLLKVDNGRDNIGWDTYPEDVPFTNEPKRVKNG